MIPKIEFRYSTTYDALWKDSIKTNKKLKRQERRYPSKKSILKYIKDIGKIWKKEGNSILKNISKVSGLKWKENDIICYVVGVGRSFSDPLSIGLYRNKEGFIDSLTHELIHQIQMQNPKKFKKWVDYVNKKYRRESGLTKSHISVHAIQKKVMMSIYGKERLNRKIDSYSREGYLRAWEIVKNEGADNIIKEFNKRVK